MMASASTTTVATTTTECLASANDILAAHAALIARVKSSQAARRRHLQSLPSPPHELVRLPLIPTPSQSRSPSPPSTPDLPPQKPREIRPDLPPAKRARLARYRNYVPEEETIRNDYSQRYVDGGEWPQNWVIGAEPERRFEEYPKQQRLLTLKKASVNEHSLPSSYLPYSSFSSLTTPSPAKFDVILIDPPFSSSFTWDNLQELPIPALAADPSFVFLWVGSGAGEGLERGRETLAKWGYRRAEDIVWVKTNNKSNKGPGTDPPTTSLLTRTKQHCLMGIRGTVRRSTDSWFVHCNVDTDVIIWEGDPSDPTLKPPEMYTLIENFCLGIRRLEIFGHARASLRRGWVTVLTEGEEEKMEPEADGGVKQWDREAWETRLKEMGSGGKYVVPMTPEIDALRPKSPVRGGSSNTHMGVGGGVSLGVPMNANNATSGVVPLGGAAMRMGARGIVGGGGGAGNVNVGFGNRGQMNQMGGMMPMGMEGMPWNGMGMNPAMGMGQQGINMNPAAPGMGMGVGMGMNMPGMEGMGMGMDGFMGGDFGTGWQEGMGMGQQGMGMAPAMMGNAAMMQNMIMNGMGQPAMGMGGMGMGNLMGNPGMSGMGGMNMGMGMGMGNMGWGMGWEGNQ